MKTHIKVIQRNGVDIFVTSSMKLKKVDKESMPTTPVPPIYYPSGSLYAEALNIYHQHHLNKIDAIRKCKYVRS